MIDRVIAALRPWRFRGKMRLLGPLVPRTGERQARVFGTPMALDLSDEIQRQMYLGCFEPQETADVRRVLRSGMTFLDVGANVGYFTLLAASCVGPTGRVLAVEPSAAAFARLERAAVGLPAVRAVRVGLSDGPGEMTLYVPPPEHGNHAPTMAAASGWEAVTVPVQTLDGLMREHGVERIDLLKVDVEGHEMRVFGGAAAALREGRIAAILVEFNEYWLRKAGGSSADLWRLLSGHGFRDAARPDQEPEWSANGIRTCLLVRR